MRCDQVKKIILQYLNRELGIKDRQSVKEHLSGCSVCQKELQDFQKSWDLLLSWKDEESAPGYISRLWTRIAVEKPAAERILSHLKEALWKPKFTPVWVTACFVFIFFIFTFSHYFYLQKTEMAFNKMDSEEIELVDNIELAEHFEVIENIEILEDFDVIENLDSLES